MCNFFSFASDGKGKYMYFDWENRKKILSGELKYEADSHSSIADFFGYKGAKEDRLNMYEYNPFTGKFTKDKINIEDDSVEAEEWVKKLDWSKVVEPLRLHPIVNPFKLRSKKVTEEDMQMLKKWASVRDSVGDSVGSSVWASVRDSVGAYCSSYFKLDQWKHIEHKKGENPFQPCIDLWNRGFVPSFDGKVWRLHSGKKAKIVYEWKKGE